MIFRAKEFAIERRLIPRKLDRPARADRRSEDRFVQRFGVRRPNGSGAAMLGVGSIAGRGRPICTFAPMTPAFALNFIKGYAGIWMQMELVIGLGVMFSTFLSGAVAMVATLGCMVIGFFAELCGRVVQKRH